MKKEFLAEIGEAIHGHQWQSALARDLAVADRTMRRWSNGDNPIPDRLSGELDALLDAKRIKVADVTERLKKFVAKGRIGGVSG